MKAPDKIKSAIGQLIGDYIELHRTGYGMVNVNTILDDLEGLVAIIDSEEDETVTDCHQLEEEIDRAIDDLEGATVKENGVLIAQLTLSEDLKDFARHFAKWGAEHLKKIEK